MMILEKVTARSDIKAIKELYLRAFPRSERKPFWLMLDKSKKGEMDILALKDEARFLGLMITIPRAKKVLLDYFAVSDELRGCGIGTSALELLKKYYDNKTIVIEIETPDPHTDGDDTKTRRERFYGRCGFIDMHIDISLFGVEMKILTLGGEIDFDEYILFYSEIFGKGIAKRIKMLKMG